MSGEREGLVLVTLVGLLDHTDGPGVRSRIEGAIHAAGDDAVIVDLSDCVFDDEEIIAEFAAAVGEGVAAGRRILIRGVLSQDITMIAPTSADTAPGRPDL
jgi:anti-anti-sigma regulatory factor